MLERLISKLMRPASRLRAVAREHPVIDAWSLSMGCEAAALWREALSIRQSSRP